jgi:N-acetylglucosaminyldiphosphoundecaprenol N-acetyl-beta-D-mannosaminyltransferase
MASDTILGVRVDPCESQGLLDDIATSIRQRRSDVYAYVNVHALNLAWSMPEFRAFLNSSHRVYCDGEGVRWAARVLGSGLPSRIALTYFFWDICREAEQSGFSMFLLGSHEDRLRGVVERIRVRHPGLKVMGTHNGFFEKNGPSSDAVLELIQAAKPDLLFIGFGMPLQESWIAANRARITVPAIFPCGSMIEYASGRKKHAPAWMSSHGMEWIYRLFQEPGRLWKRYLIGNPLFLLRVLRQRLTGSV